MHFVLQSPFTRKNKVPGLLLLSCCTVLYQVFIYTNPGFSILAIDELVITYDLDIRVTIFVV